MFKVSFLKKVINTCVYIMCNNDSIKWLFYNEMDRYCIHPKGKLLENKPF